MALVESLLGAIERVHGDALVMHVGERPYVVTPQGRVELASRALTLEAAEGLLGELLPLSEKQALSDLGAVEHPLTWGGRQDYRVIAARGGDDIWIEICRQKAKPQPAAPETAATPPTACPVPRPAESEPAQPAEGAVEAPPAAAGPLAAVGPTPGESPGGGPETAFRGETRPLSEQPGSTIESAGRVSGAVAEEAPRSDEAAFELVDETVPLEDEPIPAAIERGEETASSPPDRPAFGLDADSAEEEPVVFELNATELAQAGEMLESVAAVDQGSPPPSVAPLPAERASLGVTDAEQPAAAHVADLGGSGEAPPASSAEAIDRIEPAASVPTGAGRDRVGVETPASAGPSVASGGETPPPAVVVPMTRSAVRPEAATPPPLVARSASSDLDRLLRLAAARAASALYIVAGMRPVIRVDGEINILATEAVLDAATVQTMILDLAPEPSREALRSGALTEWICDVPDVGRVRCMSFRDHRGPGAIFRMIPARAISAEQLGLSRELLALSAQPDGLVLVTGPRSSGKSTLVAAFVDLINRTRADHVITLESQIKFVHESRRSFVSQREVRGSADEMLAAARAALREDPDVLVFEDLRTPETIAVALEAAESGRLVIGALPAPSATAAIERVIDQFPADRRPQVQQVLAGALRGVVAQVLLRKVGGGRVAARELLLNTAPVASLIASGQTFQLPLAIDSGRRHGMVPLNDALVSYVDSGAVDPREAYRWAYDKDGFVNLLKRSGLDTSFVERLA